MIKSALPLFIAIIIITSCNDEPTKTRNSFNVELTKNELFIYDTNHHGDEEGGRIVTQATNFLVSELSRDDSTFQLLYRYQPAEDYEGTDVVELELSSGSDGASPSTYLKYVTINFKISE